MKQYKTIKELYDAVKAGEINESKLEIVLDNDATSFYIGSTNDNEIEVEEGNGYYDIDKVYRLLFPKAQVERC